METEVWSLMEAKGDIPVSYEKHQELHFIQTFS